MHPDLERLIEAAIADGVITPKERSILHKKAEKLGEDLDELDMLLDGMLHIRQKAEKTTPTPTPTPTPNTPINKTLTAIICPACGSNEIQEIGSDKFDCNHCQTKSFFPVATLYQPQKNAEVVRPLDAMDLKQTMRSRPGVFIAGLPDSSWVQSMTKIELIELLKAGDEDLLIQMAAEATQPEILEELIRHPNGGIREQVGMNQATPTSLQYKYLESILKIAQPKKRYLAILVFLNTEVVRELDLLETLASNIKNDPIFQSLKQNPDPTNTDAQLVNEINKSLLLNRGSSNDLRATLLFHLGGIYRSLQCIEELIAVEPGNCWAWTSKLLLYESIQDSSSVDLDDAITIARNAIKYAPEHAGDSVQKSVSSSLVTLAESQLLRTITSFHQNQNKQLLHEYLTKVFKCIDAATQIDPNPNIHLAAALRMIQKHWSGMALKTGTSDPSNRLVKGKKKQYQIKLSEIDPNYKPKTCFPTATRILTPTGHREIGEIDPGDTVLSTNAEGQLVHATVTAKKSYGSSPITRIVLGGESRDLHTTAHHSFKTESGWKRASQLQAGDTLLRVEDSGKSHLVRIEAITTEAPEPVFNLHTTGPHNFIAEGVLAHNFTELRWLRTWAHRLFVDPFHTGSQNDSPKLSEIPTP